MGALTLLVQKVDIDLVRAGNQISLTTDGDLNFSWRREPSLHGLPVNQLGDTFQARDRD